CIAVIMNNDIYLPRVEQIIEAIGIIISGRDFFAVVLSSFARTGCSYIAALISAMILGVLSVVYPFFEYMLKPLNSIIRTIPTLVLIVLALVWFNKDMAPFIVGFAVVFPIIYEGIRNSIMNYDKRIMDMTEIYEVSKKDKMTKIYFPLVKFYIMNIFVSTFSLTFKVVIAGEVHGQPKYGIGSQVQLEKVNFNTPGIFAWIIIIMVISFIFELINRYLNKRTYRWSR
ncbi:MAG: ABC transporter permease subunit, partial [Clostridium sp.]|nr:ABC transporter permease subunit [Clostridium sp.]